MHSTSIIKTSFLPTLVDVCRQEKVPSTAPTKHHCKCSLPLVGIFLSGIGDDYFWATVSYCAVYMVNHKILRSFLNSLTDLHI